MSPAGHIPLQSTVIWINVETLLWGCECSTYGAVEVQAVALAASKLSFHHLQVQAFGGNTGNPATNSKLYKFQIWGLPCHKLWCIHPAPRTGSPFAPSRWGCVSAATHLGVPL